MSLELPPSPSELFLFPDETPQLSKPPSSLNPAFDSGCPSFVEPVGVDSSDPDSTDSDDGFCILENDPGVGILVSNCRLLEVRKCSSLLIYILTINLSLLQPKTGKPQIRMLTTEPVHLIENHFSVPLRKMDQLKAPKSFPQPVLRYTLREISLVWHLYGGLDFPRDSTGRML